MKTPLLRPPSRGMLRRAALIAFNSSRKLEFRPIARRPDVGETPLSADEIAHGVAHGLIRATPSIPRTTMEPNNESGPRGEAWL